MGLSRFKYLYKGQKFQYKNTIWEKTDTTKARCTSDSQDFKEGDIITLPGRTQILFNPKG